MVAGRLHLTVVAQSWRVVMVGGRQPAQRDSASRLISNPADTHDSTLEMAAPASSPAPVLPTLPLPRELTALLADHAQLSLTLSQHEDLLARLAALREARAQGHDQMNVPVDLGRGYMIEGVV